MTTNEPATAASTLDGPARYILALVFSLEDEEAEGVVTITVNGLTMPRVGERFIFDHGKMPLQLKVTDIAHWFFTPNDDPGHREVIVTAEPMDVDLPVARQLLDPAVLDQWCTQFAAVGPTRQ